MTGPAAIPAQRQSALQLRRALAAQLERMAVEAESQDPGHSRDAPLLVHLARLVATAPEHTDTDWARVAAVAYRAPMPPNPITGELVVPRAEHTPWD